MKTAQLTLSLVNFTILMVLLFMEPCFGLAPMYYGFDRPAIAYDLPPLPYSFTDLEPYIDAETVKVHYVGHHGKYKDSMNDVLEDWRKMGKESTRFSILEVLKNTSLIPTVYRQKFVNFAGGYVNHALYWELMLPNKEEEEREPTGKVAKDIIATYQSFKKFKLRFSDTANKLFGSGYVWLCRSYTSSKPNSARLGDLVIIITQNQDIPLTNNLFPILVIDVWEHAYYLKHKNVRTKYVKDWWNLVNWNAVEDLDIWWTGFSKHDEL